MRLKNIPGSREFIAENEWVVHDETSWKGRWRELFGNDHPLHIEIGCGKGRFITGLAAREPEVNHIGIEKYSSVLQRAIERLSGAREGIRKDSFEVAGSRDGLPRSETGGREERSPDNIRFIRMDAEYICDVFADGEVDRIYLNFSDPWPKDRHAKRRLPGAVFLARYAKLLPPGGLVEFKTDNTVLFDFALESLEGSAFELVACTRDLHHDPVMNEGNIMTEYEEKFSSQGNPICKYIIRLRS
ncbi:MAG: tRNA (guanosine(46)-N7)-methyltransferase TrmB [Lachnospiraceae bacterium]|nr:tRNA (guanosine(46)-N7)-methyltransferase TrmB [Lachnospiraceae bacterium]